MMLAAMKREKKDWRMINLKKRRRKKNQRLDFLFHVWIARDVSESFLAFRLFFFILSLCKLQGVSWISSARFLDVSSMVESCPLVASKKLGCFLSSDAILRLGIMTR